MGESNVDEMQGKVKEAAGVLAGDEDLEREGKIDQTGAKVKKAAEKAKEKVDDAVESVEEKLHH